MSYRVFHLIKGFGRGGAEMLLSEGLRYADRTRFTYGYGYFLPWKDALVPSLRGMGAEVVCFTARQPATMILSVAMVARFLRRWRADILHCHLPLAGVVGRLAGRFLGIPVIYTEHNLMERYHPWTRRANLWAWKFQGKVVAVSQDVAASIRSHAGSRIPVQVVQNGVPVESFRPNPEGRAKVRQECDIPAEAPVVGLQENVAPYLSAMDVYMMSSIFEGLPIALLEAMAMERPLVATAVGGVPEAVIAGETGVLVPPGDPSVLASAAASLLDDLERRAEMGRAGRRRIAERFSMERMARELESVYLEVLGKTHHGR